MATSITSIANKALGKLGQDVGIESLAENSKYAAVISARWEEVRDYVLADALWPFAIKAAPLALLAQAAPGWPYRYAYPEDCLNAIAVCDENGIRVVSNAVCTDMGLFRQMALPAFEVQHGDQDTSIVSDLEGAYLVYGCRVEDVSRYSPHCVEAVACRLALEVAPTIAAEAGLRLGSKIEQDYARAKERGIVRALNESNDPLWPTSTTAQARGA